MVLLFVNNTTNSTPQPLTSTSSMLPMTPTHPLQLGPIDIIVLLTFMSTLEIIGQFLSFKVIYVIVRHPKLRIRPNLLLLNLLLSDILFLFTRIPSIILISKESRPQPSSSMEVRCDILMYMAYFLAETNILALSTISFDRYMAIAYPYVYHKHMGKKYFWFVLLLPWIIGLLFMLPIPLKTSWASYLPNYLCDVRWEVLSNYYIAMLVILCAGIPLVVLFVTNVRVHQIAKVHMNELNKWRNRSRSIINTESFNETASVCHEISTTTCDDKRSEVHGHFDLRGKDRLHIIKENNPVYCHNEMQHVICNTASTCREMDSTDKRGYICTNSVPNLSKSTQAVCRSASSRENSEQKSETTAKEDVILSRLAQSTKQMPKNIPQEAGVHTTTHTILATLSEQIAENVSKSTSTRRSSDLPTQREQNPRAMLLEVHSSKDTPIPKRFLGLESLRNSKLHMQIVLSTYFLIIGFVCCWCPYVVYKLVVRMMNGTTDSQASIYFKFLPIVTATVDPLIILASRREIRRAFVYHLKKNSCKIFHNMDSFATSSGNPSD